ncbi:MAG TPA: hypothetical protein VM925_13770, partial [Labilithrix sp.]|nr:hypothetical protein [Labilithrix sp.]
IRGLTSLEDVVPLSRVLTARQRAAVLLPLTSLEARLERDLRRAVGGRAGALGDREERRRLGQDLARIEVALARAYSAFDTYVDILTQRTSPDLGALLRGCDVLALDALQRDHPALASLEPPIVHCDRGYGASVVREGVTFGGGADNAVALIQLPYSRLRDKCNLVSLVHEAGHQALVRLGVLSPLTAALEAGVRRAGGTDEAARAFAGWVSEIGADFWAFCGTGFAQTSTAFEVLAVPYADLVATRPGDPHPPPWLRPLLSVAWCRRAFGPGPWDAWAREWLAMHPLPAGAQLLREGATLAPAVAAALFETKLAALGDRPMTSLFDLRAVSLRRAERSLRYLSEGRIRLAGLSPLAHLAVFRAARMRRVLTEEALDGLMSRWLHMLAARHANSDVFERRISHAH